MPSAAYVDKLLNDAILSCDPDKADKDLTKVAKKTRVMERQVQEVFAVMLRYLNCTFYSLNPLNSPISSNFVFAGHITFLSSSKPLYSINQPVNYMQSASELHWRS